MAEKVMSSKCSNPNCPCLAENARLLVKLEFAKEQLEEMNVKIHDLKNQLSCAKEELNTVQNKCQDFGDYVNNHMKKLEESEKSYAVKMDSIVSKTELAVKSTIDELKMNEQTIIDIKNEQSNQLSNVLEETRENNKKLEKQHTDVSNEVKRMTGVLGELKNGIQEQFNVEKEFIFGKVDSFGRNLESRIIKEVDKNVIQKMVVLKNKIEDGLDEQNQDIQNLKDTDDDQYSEIENGFKEIRGDLESESKTIRVMFLGSYREAFERLEDYDGSHGALLHKMIQDKADNVILSAFITIMRPGALQWKNPENNSLNALQVAYSKLNDELISLMESYCDEDMLSKLSSDKDQCARDADIVGSYWNALVETTTTKPNLKAQGRLLFKAIQNKAPKDVISVMIKKMSNKVKSYKNSKGMDAIDLVAGKGDDYDMIYDLIETPKNKKRQHDFQSRKCLPNGTRVRRGRDWIGGDTDGRGPGIVTKPDSWFTPYGGGVFYVKWDNNGEERSYSFGDCKNFTLRVID